MDYDAVVEETLEHVRVNQLDIGFKRISDFPSTGRVERTYDLREAFRHWSDPRDIRDTVYVASKIIREGQLTNPVYVSITSNQISDGGGLGLKYPSDEAIEDMLNKTNYARVVVAQLDDWGAEGEVIEQQLEKFRNGGLDGYL